MFEVPTSTTQSVLANISSLLSDPGLLQVIVLAVSIPLVFYVIKGLIGLFPKGRSRVS